MNPDTHPNKQTTSRTGEIGETLASTGESKLKNRTYYHVGKQLQIRQKRILTKNKQLKERDVESSVQNSRKIYEAKGLKVPLDT